MTPMRTRDLDAWAVWCFGGEGDNIFFFYYYYHKNKIKLHNHDVYNARRAGCISSRLVAYNRRRARGRPEFRDENIIKTHIRRHSFVFVSIKRGVLIELPSNT